MFNIAFQHEGRTGYITFLGHPLYISRQYCRCEVISLFLFPFPILGTFQAFWKFGGIWGSLIKCKWRHTHTNNMQFLVWPVTHSPGNDFLPRVQLFQSTKHDTASCKITRMGWQRSLSGHNFSLIQAHILNFIPILDQNLNFILIPWNMIIYDPNFILLFSNI